MKNKFTDAERVCNVESTFVVVVHFSSHFILVKFELRICESRVCEVVENKVDGTVVCLTSKISHR